MQILLHCTKRVIDRLEIVNPPKLVTIDNLPFWNSWYCNLIPFGKMKCYLFTHSITLLSFMIFEGKEDIKKTIETAFKYYLGKTFELENIPKSKIMSILFNMNGIVISKTNSKVILGTMNDIAYSYLTGITREDNYKPKTFSELVKDINDMPMSALKYSTPSKKLKEIFAF